MSSRVSAVEPSGTSRLEVARLARGLSRARVGAQLGVSEKTVYRMERGATEVKEIHYLAFARLYDMQVADLKGEAAA